MLQVVGLMTCNLQQRPSFHVETMSSRFKKNVIRLGQALR